MTIGAWMMALHNSGQDMGGTDSSYYARQRGEKHPLASRSYHSIPDTTVTAAKGLRALGVSWPEISERLGRSSSALQRRCR